MWLILMRLVYGYYANGRRNLYDILCAVLENFEKKGSFAVSVDKKI